MLIMNAQYNSRQIIRIKNLNVYMYIFVGMYVYRIVVNV